MAYDDGDGEEVKYLYLMDVHRLCRVNLLELEQNQEKPPSMEVVFDFQKAGLPIGMGLFTVEDPDNKKTTICVAGGEKHTGSTENTVWQTSRNLNKTEAMQFLDQSYGDRGLGRQVYILDLKSNDHDHRRRIRRRRSSSSSSGGSDNDAPTFVPVESLKFPPMNSPKTSMYTAKVDGKVYALGTQSYLTLYGQTPSPMFEVYDPVQKTWRVLPDPPFHIRPQLFNPFYVLNRWLVVPESKRYWIFNVDTEQWVAAKEIIRSYFYNSPVPYHSGAVATYKNFTVAHDGGSVLVYFPDDCDSPMRHQVLDELEFHFEYDPSEVAAENPHDSIGHIFHLGGGKMCLFDFFCVCEYGVVTIFQLEVDQVGSSYKASAHVLRRHVYNLHALLEVQVVIRDIFVLGEQSNKHKLQHELLHESSKRQKISPYCALQMTDSGIHVNPSRELRFRNELCSCGDRPFFGGIRSWNDLPVLEQIQ